MKLFLKISNLCNHNTLTLRTDRQADRQTTCHSNTALCVASRGKNDIKMGKKCVYDSCIRERRYCQQSFNCDRSCRSSAVIMRQSSVRSAKSWHPINLSAACVPGYSRREGHILCASLVWHLFSGRSRAT